MDAQLTVEFELHDAARNPVRAVSTAPTAWRDSAGHFRFTAQDRVRFDPAYWNPARILVPEGVLDLPADRRHHLLAILRVSCDGLHARIEQQISYPPSDSEAASGGLHLIDLVTETNVSGGPERNIGGMGDDPRQPSTWAAPRIGVSATIARQPAAVTDARVELRLFHPDGRPVRAASSGGVTPEPEPFVHTQMLQFQASQAQEVVRFDVGCDEIQLHAGLEHPLIVELHVASPFTRLVCQQSCRVQHFSSGPAPGTQERAETQSSEVNLLGAMPSAISSVSSDRDNKLLAAAAAGAADRIRALMAQGADPMSCDSTGRTPLHLAAAAGHIEAVRALLASGDVGSAPASDVHTAQLSFDAYLARHRLLGATDAQGRTPLHLAAAAGHVETIRLLCEHGATVAAADERGATPLHLAAVFGRMDAVAALLAGGAYPNTRTHLGCTALDLAAAGPTRQLLEQAREKLSQGPDASAVRERTGEFLQALAANDGVRVAQFIIPDLTAQIPPHLETTRFEFRVVSAEVHGETGRARAWLKVPDIEAKTNEFVADLVLLRGDGQWRVAQVQTTPFFPSLETLEDRP
ncbi:ankyrin repeat domain-containing protein [Anaerobaca lacustris]|uniref:Ankyrin repeat domain-containing protein n=1 Tax=Anaerobaca lacustris TaxID=3044600 RepID=A0AAW6U809_9BACT|nr:ankyrin repeat domain-containing protein [Sedimentisphaerales bacterium M17dextr]